MTSSSLMSSSLLDDTKSFNMNDVPRVHSAQVPRSAHSWVVDVSSCERRCRGGRSIMATNEETAQDDADDVLIKNVRNGLNILRTSCFDGT